MGMNYRGGDMGGRRWSDGVKRGKWDNYNIIINKYIFLKRYSLTWHKKVVCRNGVEIKPVPVA